MSSFRPPRFFDPLDLQIIDLVYKAAWAELEAREPQRDTDKDDDRRELLSKKVFAVATPGEAARQGNFNCPRTFGWPTQP